MTIQHQYDLLEAAEQVLWKLSHNEYHDHYQGPGRVTRKDATVRMLQAAVDAVRVTP